MLIFQAAGQKVLDGLLQSLQNFGQQLPNYLLAILILVIGIFISRKVAGFFDRTIRHRTDDALLSSFLSRAIKAVVVLLALMVALQAAGLGGILSALVTAAGAGAVIIGFAFRDIGENFIAGIILSFNRPFNYNDVITVGDITGKVQAMEFRYTLVRTFDGRDVYIPNADILKKVLINVTRDTHVRVEFEVGIDTASDVEKAIEVAQDAVKSTDGVVVGEERYESFVVFKNFGDSTLLLQVYFWINTDAYKKEALLIKSEVLTAVNKALIGAGINLPSPIREIVFRNPVPTELENQDHPSGNRPHPESAL